MSPTIRSNITWARCGVASLLGTAPCPFFESSGVWFDERTNCPVFFYGRVCNQTTNTSVNWGHEVLLDPNHDLLNSIVELSGQHNQEPNGSHT